MAHRVSYKAYHTPRLRLRNTTQSPPTTYIQAWQIPQSSRSIVNQTSLFGSYTARSRRNFATTQRRNENLDVEESRHALDLNWDKPWKYARCSVLSRSPEVWVSSRCPDRSLCNESLWLTLPGFRYLQNSYQKEIHSGITNSIHSASRHTVTSELTGQEQLVYF